MLRASPSHTFLIALPCSFECAVFLLESTCFTLIEYSGDFIAIVSMAGLLEDRYLPVAVHVEFLTIPYPQ